MDIFHKKNSRIYVYWYSKLLHFAYSYIQIDKMQTHILKMGFYKKILYKISSAVWELLALSFIYNQRNVAT